MGIKYFIISILTISLGVMFLDSNKNETNVATKEKPTMIFEDATIYTMDDMGLQRVIDAKKALIYNNKEEAFEANVIIKTDKEKVYDRIVSDYVLKKGDKISLVGNVSFRRNDFIRVKTEELFYNLETQIAHNTKDFVAFYYDNQFTGNSFYLKEQNYFDSKDVKATIKLKKD